jgi:hypothetical protein
MRQYKCLTGIGAEMPEQTILHVVNGQRQLQERIVAKVDHSDAKIICGAPVGVHVKNFFIGDLRRRVQGVGLTAVSITRILTPNGCA